MREIQSVMQKKLQNSDKTFKRMIKVKRLSEKCKLLLLDEKYFVQSKSDQESQIKHRATKRASLSILQVND